MLIYDEFVDISDHVTQWIRRLTSNQKIASSNLVMVYHFSDCTSMSRTRKIKLMGVGKIKKQCCTNVDCQALNCKQLLTNWHLDIVA